MTAISWKHWVFLSDDQLAHATEVGTIRHVEARKHGRRHWPYKERDPAKDLATDILAAKSELAGKVFIGPWAKWDRVQYDRTIKNCSDIEGFIDVKEVDDASRRLIVPVNKLNRAWAYMLVYCNEPWFWIKGWKWGEHIGPKELKGSREKGRPCFVVEDRELHDPPTLIEVALGGKNA